ncbi:MAG: prepilin peptidase CpaA [Methylobacteriaceae bacterium]|jgi:prepilin peptidase CpaA|nr:prepilin peptidase CpaA [Methylobacteriaceae bacterium]
MLAMLMIAAFPGLLAYAAFSDLFTMTISNRISIALVVGFLVVAGIVHMPIEAIASHVGCGLAVLAGTFVLFAMGWVGGGDAKLAAATALWLGFEHLADYGLVAALIGGALTLTILQLRKLPMPRWAIKREWIARLHESDSGIPYGIALAIAGVLVYPDTSIWVSAITL